MGEQPVLDVQWADFAVERFSEPADQADTSQDTGVAAAAAAPAIEPLTITVAQLLANDRPGPDNESAQSMTVTDVVAGPFTHGTVTFIGGIVTYLPDEDFVGNATIPYTVCDNGTTNGQPDPRCSTGGISVAVTQNHPPVVVPQSVTAVEDDAGRPDAVRQRPRRPGDRVRGHHAAVARRADRHPAALTYTPAPDANGTDSFTFTANDGNDQSLPATVTIAVTAVNDPPVPQPDTVDGPAPGSR